MATVLVVCGVCGEVNTTDLLSPVAEITFRREIDRKYHPATIECRGCRRWINFRRFVACPACKVPSDIDLDQTTAQCSRCGVIVNNVPLMSGHTDRNTDKPWGQCEGTVWFEGKAYSVGLLHPGERNPQRPIRPHWIRRVFNPGSEAEYQRSAGEYREYLDRRQDERFQVFWKMHREWASSAKEASARAEWGLVYARYKTTELKALSGKEFEHFIGQLFLRMGFDVRSTPGGSDQGADLVAWKADDLTRVAVQAKRYKAKVGNRAVQELLGGMLFYKCARGSVVTTSTFTKSATDLAAQHPNIELWDFEKLVQLHQSYLTVPPPFAWDEYERVKQSLRSLLSKRSRRKRN